MSELPLVQQFLGAGGAIVLIAAAAAAVAIGRRAVKLIQGMRKRRVE